MFLQRNVASQVFTLPGTLRVIADGSAVTSGAAITWIKDGTSGASAGTLTHVSDGAYTYQPTQGETDAKICGWVLSKTGAAGLAGSIRTTNADPNDGVRLGQTALPNTACASNASLLTVGTGTAQVNASAGKVPATLAATDVTGNVAADLQTIKTQTVTCAAGVTVNTNVGTTQAITFDANNLPKVDVEDIRGATSAGVAGYVGLDWSHINAPTTIVNLSGTTIATVTNTVNISTAAIDLALTAQGYTAARAVYLDNLNVGGAVASHADITAINQSASKHLLLSTVGQYAPGETYTVEMRTYAASDGSAVNADTTPTLTATGALSGSLSANLSAATNPATGLYRWTYTPGSSPTLEQIRFDGSATIASATFTLSAYAQTVDAPTAVFTATDKTNLTAIFNKLPTNAIADETLLLAAIGSPQQAGSAVTLPANPPAGFLATASYSTAPGWYTAPDNADIATLLARIPGTVQPQTGDSYARLGAPAGASVSADIAAAKADTAAIRTVTGELGTMLAIVGAGPNYQYTAQALANAPAGGGGGSLTASDVWTYATRTLTALPSPAPAGYGPGGGSGTTAVTHAAGGTARNPSDMTVEDGSSNPIMGAVVQAYLASAYAANPATAQAITSTTTDVNGHWAINLPNGATYTLVFSYPGDAAGTGSVTV